VSKASSPFEFFIVMDKDGTPHLDNDHTVFGKVVSGMDVAEKIAKVKTGNSEWPIDNVEMDIEILD
jgi:peptidyl-prolyl cis-trans isomerase A (cyclophilin A)